MEPIQPAMESAQADAWYPTEGVLLGSRSVVSADEADSIMCSAGILQRPGAYLADNS